MNRRAGRVLSTVLFLVLFASALGAQPVLSNLQVVDVTSRSITLIAESSEPATPSVRVYEDALGTIEITESLEILPFPIRTGDPSAIGFSARAASKRGLQTATRDLGLLRLQLTGLSPSTTVYVALDAESASGSATVPPAGALLAVTTSSADIFLTESKYLVVTVDDLAGAIDPTGWVVTAGSAATQNTVSAVVGDAAGTNQAFIDLGQLRGLDGLEWQPLGIQSLQLEVFNGPGLDDASGTAQINFSGNFEVADGESEDVVPTIFIDTDLDGLGDPWEIQFFGDLGRDGTGDFDGDGLTEFVEFELGSDPTRNNLPTLPLIYGPELGARSPTLDTDVELFNRRTVSSGLPLDFDYEAQLFAGGGFTTQVTATLLSQNGVGALTWDLPPLVEDERYDVRVRMTDGTGTSAWVYGSFGVSAANAAPAAPVVSFPADLETVDTTLPTLEVLVSEDADGDLVTVVFETFADAALTSLVETSSPVAVGTARRASWTPTAPIGDGQTTWWLATASDGSTSTAGVAVSFTVDLANGAPTIAALSPTPGSLVSSLTPTLSASGVDDPEMAATTVRFELDTVPSFDSADLQSSGDVTVVGGVADWDPAAPLVDDTLYFVRARANDGATSSPWSDFTFRTSTADDAPTVPIVRNPGGGAWVETTQPLLEVFEAIDPEGAAVTYEWELYGGPDLLTLVESGTTASPAWIPATALTDLENYGFRVRANDGVIAGAWTALTPFFVNLLIPLPPIAEAGMDFTGVVAQPIQLDGSASVDVNLLGLDFLWTIRETPLTSVLVSGDFSDPMVPQPQITPDADGSYRFELEVSDGVLVDIDWVRVDVVPATPPVAVASDDQSALVGDVVTVDAVGSFDPDGGPQPLSYSWSFTQLPAASVITDADITDALTDTASFTPDVAGIFELTVVVSDGLFVDSDVVLIDAMVANVPPNADAGTDVVITLGDIAFLDGSGSNDPDAMPSPITYDWRFVTVPPTSLLVDADITDATTEFPSFVPDVEGAYLLELFVSDGDLSDLDNVTVTVGPAFCDPITDLVCASDPPPGIVELTWTNGDTYANGIQVVRDSVVVAMLMGDETSYSEVLPAGSYTYEVIGDCGPTGGGLTAAATCTVDHTVGPIFVRGDCVPDGQFQLIDVITLLSYVFGNGTEPDCLDACDFDDNGSLELFDVIQQLAFQFVSGPPPQAPYPDCAVDPTDGDALGCGEYDACP